MSVIDRSDDDPDNEETHKISVRVPKNILSRVNVVGADQKCRNQSAAIVYVLEEGLGSIDRTKAKPLRLEKLCARIEWLASMACAILYVSYVTRDNFEEIERQRKKLMENLR